MKKLLGIVVLGLLFCNIGLAKNCTENEDQEKVEEIPLENPMCVLLDHRSGLKEPVGISELRKVMKEANFEWNYTRLPLPSDYEYDPGCDYGSY